MAPNKFAVLIGVDNYDEPEEGGIGQKKDRNDKPIRYGCLRGAVRDVLRMRHYLIKQVAVNVDNIRMLLSVPYNEEDPIVVAAKNNNVVFGGPNTPTYDNIVCKLKWALEKANSGDLVYIHFSGHGAQATTVFPKLKGNDGYDEALVPTDANRGGKYIRDVEIALLLKKMVCKGLVVTVVLDCCHSGGVTRGGESTGDDGEYTGIRGVHKIYKSVDDDWPEDAFLDELIEHGIMKQDDVARDGNSPADGLLTKVDGYALLAACSPYELAREHWSVTANATVYYGVLTHWLLDSLDRDPGAASSSTRNLHRSVVANLHNSYGHTQSPMIGGLVDRYFFGTRDIEPIHDILVDRVCTVPPGMGTELHIDVGALHNVREGSVYGIYPSKLKASRDGAKGGNLDELLALAEVDEEGVGPTSSATTLKKVKDGARVEAGCRAILRGVREEYQTRIGFVPGNARHQGNARHHIDGFCKALNEMPEEHRVWINPVTGTREEGHGEEGSPPPPTFLIALKGSGRDAIIEIQNHHGNPIPNLSPPARPLCPGREASAQQTIDVWKTLAYRLRHLILYQTARRLTNNDMACPMKSKFVFKLIGGKQRGQPMEPVDEKNGRFIIHERDEVHICVRNDWDKDVFFNVLDFRPLFGVKRVWPPTGDSEPLAANSEMNFHLRATIPHGLPDSSTYCVDTLKAIFTTCSTRFDTMELLDLSDAEGRTRGGDEDLTASLNPLQDMLDKLGSPFRDLSPDIVQDWASESIMVRTYRRGMS